MNQLFRSRYVLEAAEPQILDDILALHSEFLQMRRSLTPTIFHGLHVASRASVLCQQSREILEFYEKAKKGRAKLGEAKAEA